MTRRAPRRRCSSRISSAMLIRAKLFACAIGTEGSQGGRHASRWTSLRRPHLLLPALRSPLFGNANSALYERKQHTKMCGLLNSDGQAEYNGRLQAHSTTRRCGCLTWRRSGTHTPNPASAKTNERIARVKTNPSRIRNVRDKLEEALEEVERLIEELEASRPLEPPPRLTKGRRRSAPTTRRISKRAKRKAAEMAGQEIDRLGDRAATGEERARRKRQLIKGPREFRDVRADLPKNKS